MEIVPSNQYVSLIMIFTRGPISGYPVIELLDRSLLGVFGSVGHQYMVFDDSAGPVTVILPNYEIFHG